ncbi:MAG: DNA-3-methyladenine glycosylase [Cyanobacteria bacterium J06634_6]
MPNPLPADWFNRPSTQVATDLIGCTLARRINDETIRGQIVETEAYEAGDPAMHLYRNKTERNAVVFGPAGIAYVYRIYRQYHCFNIVTDRDEFASTILIRAVHLDAKPSWYVSNRRAPKKDAASRKPPKPEKLEKIAAGPGKLCRALQIDESLKGIAIHPDSGLWVEPRPAPIADSDITQTTRIGLSRGADLPWRWYLSNSPAVSKR